MRAATPASLLWAVLLVALVALDPQLHLPVGPVRAPGAAGPRGCETMLAPAPARMPGAPEGPSSIWGPPWVAARLSSCPPGRRTAAWPCATPELWAHHNAPRCAALDATAPALGFVLSVPKVAAMQRLPFCPILCELPSMLRADAAPLGRTQPLRPLPPAAYAAVPGGGAHATSL